MNNSYTDSELKTIDKCRRISDSLSEQFLNIEINSLIEKAELEKEIKIDIKNLFREYLLKKYRENRLNDNTIETYLSELLDEIFEKENIREGDTIVIEEEPADMPLL